MIGSIPFWNPDHDEQRPLARESKNEESQARDFREGAGITGVGPFIDYAVMQKRAISRRLFCSWRI